MSTERLTPDEETALANVYRRDVHNWGWSHWINMVRKFGEAPMGFSWVLLPYRPESVMPAIRRRMNDLYLAALKDQAAEYDLHIRLDCGSNKLILSKAEE